jgi:UPF0716 protein FxsA
VFLRLLFLLTFIPFIELYFLVRLSQSFGFGNTVLLVLATGVFGAWLLRQQGHSILMDLQKQGSQGQLPSEALVRGFFTFIGGVLLLTPGVLTDVIGLSLIFPLTQVLWKKYLMGQWERGIQSGQIHVFTQQDIHYQRTKDPYQRNSDSPGNRRSSFDSSVIDIEARSTTVEKKNKD